MKIVGIVRLLLGLVFLVIGLNAFLQFLNGPIPGGLAGQFLQSLFHSHCVLAIGACCRNVASTVSLIFLRTSGSAHKYS
jgi:hypothetical protein